MRYYIALLTGLIMLSGLAYADTNTNNGVGNTIVDNAATYNGGYIGDHSGNTKVHQSQNQHQSQHQNQSQSIKNSGNSSSYSSAHGGSVKGSGNSDVSVAAQDRNPVSTAFAAPLTVGSDSCMGSSSAGGQGVGFGLSLGTTWHDEACERRHDAVTLHNLGQGGAALALMCQDEKVAKAMAASGRICPGTNLGDLSPKAVQTESRRSTAARANSEGVVYEYPTAKGYRW